MNNKTAAISTFCATFNFSNKEHDFYIHFEESALKAIVIRFLNLKVCDDGVVLKLLPLSPHSYAVLYFWGHGFALRYIWYNATTIRCKCMSNVFATDDPK
jgi:hypothetical protein